MTSSTITATNPIVSDLFFDFFNIEILLPYDTMRPVAALSSVMNCCVES